MKFIDARNALIIDGDDVVSNLVTTVYGMVKLSRAQFGHESHESQVQITSFHA